MQIQIPKSKISFKTEQGQNEFEVLNMQNVLIWRQQWGSLSLSLKFLALCVLLCQLSKIHLIWPWRFSDSTLRVAFCPTAISMCTLTMSTAQKTWEQKVKLYKLIPWVSFWRLVLPTDYSSFPLCAHSLDFLFNKLPYVNNVRFSVWVCVCVSHPAGL